MHHRHVRWTLTTLMAVLLVARPSAAASRTTQTSRAGDGAAVTTGPAGEFIVSADLDGLRFEKSVFADGATVLVLRSDGGEVRIASSEAQISVTVGGATHRILPGVADAAAERVRVALARSETIGLFRRFSADMELRGASTPFDHAVLMSGALVAELAGDVGAIRRLAKLQRGTGGARIRPARAGQFEDCWYQYELSIMRAFNQYQLCLAEGGIATYRAMWFSYCDTRYLAQSESAWFQYLACSSFNIF